MHLLALRLTKYSRNVLSFNPDGSSNRAHEHLFVLRPVCIEVEHLNTNRSMILLLPRLSIRMLL